MCPHHVTVPVILGKSMCQLCLDRRAICKLPKAARKDAWKRADETREDRMNGNYKCPVWGYTESELITKFPSQCTKSVWEFDHIGDSFRGIISGSANRVLKTLTSKQLTLCADYVGRSLEAHA